MTLALDDHAAASALVLMLDPHRWRHRRVDSVHLETGERGRWKASIDCTPPGAGGPVIPYSEGHYVLPLAFVEKGPMRDLDVTDAVGAPLPLLTSSENTQLAEAVLRRALAIEGVLLTETLTDALRRIVGGRGGPADAEQLLKTGRFGDRQVLSAFDLSQIGPATRALMTNLAASFILAVVVREELLGSRQLIKFSYFWHVNLVDEVGWAPIITGSFGLATPELGVRVPMAGDAASFHLEFHPPEGLMCTVDLPSSEIYPGRGFSDTNVTQVGHAYAAYHPADPALTSRAAVGLLVSLRGPWLMTLVLALFTFLFFLLGLWLDGALYVLRGQVGPTGDNPSAFLAEGVDPSALLLTLPGVVIGLLVSTREHVLASYLLLPVRAAAVTCSALLLIMSASLTFQLRDPVLVPLWNVALVLSGAILFALVAGGVRRFRTTRVGGKG